MKTLILIIITLSSGLVIASNPRVFSGRYTFIDRSDCKLDTSSRAYIRVETIGGVSHLAINTYSREGATFDSIPVSNSTKTYAIPGGTITSVTSIKWISPTEFKSNVRSTGKAHMSLKNLVY
jgi:hypothetical protein